MSADYFAKLRIVVKNDNEKAYATVEDSNIF